MNPLSSLEGLYIYRSGCGEASKLVTTFAEYHILVCTKIAVLVNVFLGGPVIKVDFKNSRISTTVAIIYLATRVPEALYFIITEWLSPRSVCQLFWNI